VSGGNNPETEEALTRSLPEVAAQLREALRRLEREFADIQDVEFTIENGKLWMLQTRSAKRTPQAALRLAIEFVKEGRIAPGEALRRLNGLDLRTLVHKRLEIAEEPAGRGTCASTGIAVGRAVFDPESAARLAASGEPVIFIRPDTTTADVGGFAIAAGIVTAVGGRTAHAALVARQLGKPCIVGCRELSIDVAGHCARLAEVEIKEGDWLSIDGEAAAIYLGRGNVVAERPEAELAEVESWRAAAP
jgi:pyruvate,orthophosphate dikinase